MLAKLCQWVLAPYHQQCHSHSEWAGEQRGGKEEHWNSDGVPCWDGHGRVVDSGHCHDEEQA